MHDGTPAVATWGAWDDKAGHDLAPRMLSALCRQLTRALLAEDYGVSWWVPNGHLIPPVTNRANYIHWLHSLLELCPGSCRPSPWQLVCLLNQRCRELCAVFVQQVLMRAGLCAFEEAGGRIGSAVW